MPAATRKGDICTGHGCFPPRASSAGSATVFVDGIAVHRTGDGWSLHSCPDVPPHGGVLGAGSPDVFSGGQAIGRIGDPVSCGSGVASGSATVFLNEL